MKARTQGLRGCAIGRNKRDETSTQGMFESNIFAAAIFMWCSPQCQVAPTSLSVAADWPGGLACPILAEKCGGHFKLPRKSWRRCAVTSPRPSVLPRGLKKLLRVGRAVEPVIAQAQKDVSAGLRGTDLRGKAAENFDHTFGPRTEHGAVDRPRSTGRRKRGR